MTDAEILEFELEKHRQLRDALASSWNPFFARFGRLRPIQVEAIPAILAGKDILITAPTAGGKTEAVLAPVCERLSRENWQGLSVLVVTPTRALVNDLFERLRIPVGEMGITVGRKTADHALSAETTEQILITTPESLESLLTFRRGRLENLRTLIIDEVHLLDGSPRGDQLRIILQRLRLYLAQVAHRLQPLQLVALSATLPNSRKTADRYLGVGAEIVSVPGQRSVESSVIIAQGGDGERAAAAVQAAEVFVDVRKMLVFVNSRKAVDASGHFFQTSRFSNATVHCHHGSLSKSERELTEQRFKEDRIAVCVSTMTLEIGIDIGDVDLVVCMSPPSGISSFLQRIGRGCRRLQGVTRVLCVARNRGEQLIFEAMLAAAQQPIPDGPLIPFRRSVLIQQILAYLRQVDKNRRDLTQFRRAFCTAVAPAVESSAVDAVLREVCDLAFVAERQGIYEPASLGWEFIQSSRIYANIETPAAEIHIFDVDTGRRISTAAGLSPDGGQQIRIAGKPFEVVGTQGSKVSVRAAKDSYSPPEYRPKGFAYAFDVGVSLARHMGMSCNRLVAFSLNDRFFVMTWLGKLVNSMLADVAGQLGIDVTPSCFSLRFPISCSATVLEMLRRTIDRMSDNSSIDSVPVERLADLGPYFGEFSPGVQKLCRRDWLDLEFLRKWFEQIKSLEILGQDDPAVGDLRTIAMIE